ncbi:MAG: helix-turn-helix transcriptional regulator [Polyangiaceae bacterium]
MDSSDALRLTIKRILRTQGVTYREIANGVGLSESSVKRIFSRGSDLRVSQLERICRYLNLDLFEVTRLAAQESAIATTTLTLKQERAFVAEPKLFWFFLFVAKQASVEGVRKRFKLDARQVERYLIQLDRLALIELRERNQFKVLASPTVRWAKNGPLARWLYEMGRKVFLSSNFDGDDEFFKFYIVKFTAESFARFKARLEQLAEEVLQTALDFDVLSADTTRTGVLMALKPMDVSALELHARSS